MNAAHEFLDRERRWAGEIAIHEAERRLTEAQTVYADAAAAGEVDDGRRHDAVLLAEIDLRKAHKALHDLATVVTPRPPDPRTAPRPERPPVLHGLRKRIYTEAMWWRYLSRITEGAS